MTDDATSAPDLGAPDAGLDAGQDAFGAERMLRPIRLLVLETPGPARQSMVALAKVLGVEDITVVECLSDAYSALENAPFDAVIYDADEQSLPIEGLIGQLRCGGLGEANTAATVIAKSKKAARKTRRANLAAPDAVLAKPLHVHHFVTALTHAGGAGAARAIAA